MGTLHSPDVAIAGAGPAGCITALAFAKRGARVLLVDGHPKAARRLAGEWLHPPAVRILQELGLTDICHDAEHGRGFIIFPQDGSLPIALHYPNDGFALSCDHYKLVCNLREAVRAERNIQFLCPALATRIDGQRLVISHQDSIHTVFADLIVGADGRSSLARRSIGLKDDRAFVSSMAGVLLEDVELLVEGFGQVLLGGPGPALACRIGPRQVRLFLDMPLSMGKVDKDANTLWKLFHNVLPPQWIPAFRFALENQRVAWAVNQCRSRLHYGRPGLALVGDAVGHFHPLTAVGMTLGFLDGFSLANSDTFEEYRHERSQRSEVAEMLATALYSVFSWNDAASLALRNAVFTTWRQSPAECKRTIRLLSGEETKLAHFNWAFLRVLYAAVQRVVSDSLLGGRWKHTASVFFGIGKWLRWLAAGNVPGVKRPMAMN